MTQLNEIDSDSEYYEAYFEDNHEILLFHGVTVEIAAKKACIKYLHSLYQYNNSLTKKLY
jgi:hypothetical protein